MISPGGRCWPAGVLGMIVLVAIGEWACPVRCGNPLGGLLGLAGHRTGRGLEAAGADVLCFGDSQMKQGVMPRVIEARSGLRA